MSDGMGREFTYLSSHATNRYFIPNWGKVMIYVSWVHIKSWLKAQSVFNPTISGITVNLGCPKFMRAATLR